jgi:hypothetical protein
VRAQIVEYKLEENQDIHLVLFDRGAYLIAEMPAAPCLTRKTRGRRAIIHARRLFEARCLSYNRGLGPGLVSEAGRAISGLALCS